MLVFIAVLRVVARVDANKVVVGGGQIVVPFDVVAQVTADDGGPVSHIVDMVYADEGHLLADMAPDDVATNHVPLVGVEILAENAPTVKLRDNGKLALSRGEVALDGNLHIFGGAF